MENVIVFISMETVIVFISMCTHIYAYAHLHGSARALCVDA
jgi:hypothetical protein